MDYVRVASLADLGMGQIMPVEAAGVKLLLDPSEFQIRHRGGLLSSDGRLCSFDASARGYVRGEGVGCVVLKRLSNAVRNGDTVHAVIAGVGGVAQRSPGAFLARAGC